MICYIILSLVSHLIIFSLFLQIVKFTTLMFVHSFDNAYGWKRLSLSFQVNIDKDLQTMIWIWMMMFYTTSRMLLSIYVRWWCHTMEGSTIKTSIVFSSFDQCFSKSKSIVANLSASISIKSFIFPLIFFSSYAHNINHYVSLIVLFVIVLYYVFNRPSIHACRTLKCHLLALEGDKDIFNFILKPLIMQSPLPIGKDINWEDSDDPPIVNLKAVDLFCE